MTGSRSSLTLLCAFLFTVGIAQRPGGRTGERPAIATIVGKILDPSTGQPIEFATVALLTQRNDSLINGTLTRGNGDLRIEKVPFGRFTLSVSHIGYITLRHSVELSPGQLQIDVGDLLLQADEQLLQEVEVLGTRNNTVLQVDRRVYNVDRDLSVQGGTAEDVMKNIPGLTVDPDGKVELRDRSPRILIDGRPTFITLDQIPAEEIERVEVITNPSVIFDASSTRGILNIVLKQSTKPGYSGSLQGGIGTNDRYRGRGDLRVKESLWSSSISAGYDLRRRPTNGFTDRSDLLDGEVIGHFEQNSRNRSTSERLNLRLGLDRDLSVRNSVSLGAGLFGGSYDNHDVQTSSTSNAFGTTSSFGDRINDQLNQYQNLFAKVGFKRKTRKPEKEWTVDMVINRSDRETDATFTDRTYDTGGALEDQLVQRSFGGTTSEQVSFQADVVDPYKDNKKIEWGMKSTWGRDNTDLNVLNTPLDAGTFVDTALSNNYRITDIVNAVYLNWATRLDSNWSMQAGLRVEQTWFEARLPEKDLAFDYKYPSAGKDLDKTLFPAIYLSRKWKGLRELQVNVSRKIERPNFWQIMPFILFSDSRSFRIGNPALGPELNNLGEVNHLLPFTNDKGSWLTSFYVRWSEDVITEYVYNSPSDPDILITSFQNGDDSWSYGWENTLRSKFTSAFEATLSGNVQWVSIQLSEGSNTISNQGINYNGKVNLRYDLPKDFSFQVNGDYNGPRILAQGTRREQYVLDLTLNKDFARKWNISLSLQDVFNSRYWWYEYETTTFIQEIQRRRDTRYLMFTATWRFGERDASIFRRRGSSERREPGSSGDDDGM